jgi:hypothetical protein
MRPDPTYSSAIPWERMMVSAVRPRRLVCDTSAEGYRFGRQAFATQGATDRPSVFAAVIAIGLALYVAVGRAMALPALPS